MNTTTFVKCKNKYKVHQEVEHFSDYDFEGSLDEIISRIEIKKSCCVVGKEYYTPSPKTSEKKFSFESFYVERRQVPYDDYYLYYIIGVRNPNEEELKALQKEEKESLTRQKQFRQEQFEKLKKEFMTTTDDQEINHP